MADKPPQQKAALENSVGFDLRTMTPAELDLVKAYYYGMISENDKYIGAMTQGRSLFEFPTIKMARTREWKLVHYTRAKYGELYDLAEDPYELTNRFADPGCASARAGMLRVLFDWLASTADPKLAPIRSPEEPTRQSTE
ncbi:MAG: DUF4976 domain-containing protein [Acidobacteriaceae bacterium]|nr:DUF4976 domain-containing protein [Acidobacteriaceae bacterium]